MTNTTFTEKQDIFNKTIIKYISKMSEKDRTSIIIPISDHPFVPNPSLSQDLTKITMSPSRSANTGLTSEEKKTKYLCTLEEKHKKAIVNKQDQQYYAALPHKLQEAKKIENLFESLELKQEEIKKKKDDIDFLFNNNKGKIDIEEKDNEKYQQNDT